MLVSKCDLCGTEIKDKSSIVRAGIGYPFSTYEFCSACSKPVKTFLEKIEKKLKVREAKLSKR